MQRSNDAVPKALPHEQIDNRLFSNHKGPEDLIDKKGRLLTPTQI